MMVLRTTSGGDNSTFRSVYSDRLQDNSFLRRSLLTHSSMVWCGLVLVHHEFTAVVWTDVFHLDLLYPLDEGQLSFSLTVQDLILSRCDGRISCRYL